MNKQKWHSAFLKAFFTNRWSAPVPSITHWLRAKMPAATFKQSTTGRCEFVKNAFKNAELPLLLIHDLSFSFIYIPYNRTLFKPPHRECMFYCIDNNNICLPLHKLKTNNIQHTHLHKFFNLVIVLTLDFWYMIKTK